MAKIREKISWIVSDSATLDPSYDIEQLKTLGSIWGSWRTWRTFQTDNVVCHDQVKAAELIQREFQNKCNFYIPDSAHASLDRPMGVKLYAGEFVHDVTRPEELVAMHLAATTSDIVLLLGWDLAALNPETDLLLANQTRHHRNMVRQAFLTYAQTQWVVLDHSEDLDPNIALCENVVKDTLNTVLDMI